MASLLGEFRDRGCLHRIHPGHDEDFHYLVELLEALARSRGQEAFLVRSHIGNYALFLSGIFPDYIYYRHQYRRMAPSLSYYEEMGRVNYHLAASHDLARGLGLSEILEFLAGRFSRVRLALNMLADRHPPWTATPGSPTGKSASPFTGERTAMSSSRGHS